MDLREAQEMAEDLMLQHGLLPLWQFDWDGSKRRFGVCRYHNRTISLSRHLVALNSEEEVRNTILHEIAHALAPGSGHNWHWKSVALKIGAKPERCYSPKEVEVPQSRYNLVCANCGYKRSRYKSSNPKRKRACGECCRKYNGGRFTEKFILTLQISS